MIAVPDILTMMTSASLLFLVAGGLVLVQAKPPPKMKDDGNFTLDDIILE